MRERRACGCVCAQTVQKVKQKNKYKHTSKKKMKCAQWCQQHKHNTHGANKHLLIKETPAKAPQMEVRNPKPKVLTLTSTLVTNNKEQENAWKIKFGKDTVIMLQEKEEGRVAPLVNLHF